MLRLGGFNPYLIVARSLACGILAGATEIAFGQVFSYECDTAPETTWEVAQVWCEPVQWLAGGWYHQQLELCPEWPLPNGQMAAYRRPLGEFVGVRGFFLEWVAITDAPRSEIPWGGGAAVALGNDGGVRYTFFVASDQVKLNRDNLLPIVFVDIQPGVPHIYRLELVGGELFIWFIDGQVVASGAPEGAFTCCQPRVTWLGRSAYFPNTTSWDYIRYGALRETAPGDANCDGAINLFDIDPFVMALFDPVAFNTATPDCSLTSADLNGDLHVNFFDIDPFVECLFGACP